MHSYTSRGETLAIDMSLFAVRFVGGLIMAAHGAQKLFGWWGGPGMGPMVQNLGLIAWPVSIGEFFGGLGLMIGFLSRFSAASNIVIMIGAIVIAHGANGFFLQNKGFEYNLALIALFIPTMLVGPGNWAIGRYLPLPKNSAGRVILPLE